MRCNIQALRPTTTIAAAHSKAPIERPKANVPRYLRRVVKSSKGTMAKGN